MITVDINELDGPCLLVSHPTGVTFRHQCGGLSCHQREREGFLLPLTVVEAGRVTGAEAQKQLDAHFYRGPKYKGGRCYSGMDDEDAELVDGLLRWLVVDRTRLPECVEAWVPLVMEDPDSPCLPYCYGSAPNAEVVLIWENSD